MRVGDVVRLSGIPCRARSVIRCAALIRSLARYGVFVVPYGEVQSWLPGLNVKARKDRWLAAMFERIGNDPEEAGYVTPRRGDAWGLLGRISKWIKNPMRKGMPP